MLLPFVMLIGMCGNESALVTNFELDTLDSRIAAVSTLSQVRTLKDSIVSSSDAHAAYMELLLIKEGQDPRRSVLLACMYVELGSTSFGDDFIRELAKRPAIVDIIWQYQDWQWSASKPGSFEEVSQTNAEAAPDLLCLLNGCSDTSRGHERFDLVLQFIAQTGHHELLAGESIADILAAFDLKYPEFLEEAPYLRFDEAMRKYVIDQDARASGEAVNVRFQERVGRPDGPGVHWVGERFVGG